MAKQEWTPPAEDSVARGVWAPPVEDSVTVPELKKKDFTIKESRYSGVPPVVADLKKSSSVGPKNEGFWTSVYKSTKDFLFGTEAELPKEDNGLNPVASFAGSFNKNVIDVFTGIPKTVAIAAAGITGEDPKNDILYKAADWLQKRGEKEFGQTNPVYEKTNLVGGTAGMLLAFSMGGASGRTSKLADLAIPSAEKAVIQQAAEHLPAAFMASAGTAATEYENALNSGATEETAFKAWRKGMVTGVPFLISPTFKAFDKTTGGSLKYGIAKGVEGGIVGLFQMATSHALTNLGAQETYDKTREIVDGVLGAGGSGFAINGVLAGVLAAVSHKSLPSAAYVKKALAKTKDLSNVDYYKAGKPEAQPIRTPTGDLGKEPYISVNGKPDPVVVATNVDADGNSVTVYNTGLKDTKTGGEVRVEEIKEPDGNVFYQTEDGHISGPTLDTVTKQIQHDALPVVSSAQMKKANDVIKKEGATKATLKKIYTDIFGYPEHVAADFADTGVRIIDKEVKDSNAGAAEGAEKVTPEKAFTKLQKEGPPKGKSKEENTKEVFGEKTKVTDKEIADFADRIAEQKLDPNDPAEQQFYANNKVAIEEKLKEKLNAKKDTKTNPETTGEPVVGGKSTAKASADKSSGKDKGETNSGKDVSKPAEVTEEKVTIKVFDKPDMEYPVHEVKIGDRVHYIQRSDGMNPGDTAWYEVVQDKKGGWKQLPNDRGETGVGGGKFVGHTKAESANRLALQNSIEVEKSKPKTNAVQKSETGKVGERQQEETGKEGVQRGGVEPVKQGPEAPDKQSPPDQSRTKPSEDQIKSFIRNKEGENPSLKYSTGVDRQGRPVIFAKRRSDNGLVETIKMDEVTKKPEPSEASMDAIDKLSTEIFPSTVKEFIESMKEFEEYSGPTGQAKAMARLKQMEVEGLVKIEENKITPTFQKKGNGYAPQSEESVVHTNVKRKNPISIIKSSIPGFMFDTDLGRLWNNVNHVFKKYFTSKGYLPQEVFDRWNKTRAETKVYEAKVRFAVNDLKKALREEYGSVVTDAQVTDLNLALQGKPTSQGIPPKTMQVITDMRDMVDNLSCRFVDEGIVSGDLAAKFMDNLGVYLTRSYRKFDDPSWSEDFATQNPQAFNQAEAFLRAKYPKYSDAEIAGLIDYLLYSPEAPMNIVKGGTMGKIDLSVLKKRGKIAPEIRALMGEYADPIVNFARSIQKMADLVSKFHFQQDVKNDGLGSFLFKVSTGKYSHPVKMGRGSAPSPLDGLYTTKEIAEAFNEFNGPQPNPPWLKWILRQNARVNLGLTVLSPTTHSRNFFANVFFSVMNGHYRLKNVAKTRAAWENVLASDDKAMRAKMEEYVSLGILNDGVTAGMLKDYLGDISNGIDAYTPVNDPQSKILRIRGKLKVGAEHLYQWGDNVYKIFAFENEARRYRNAYPAWTKEQVNAKAAEVVLNTYPTYSRIPKIVSKYIKNIPTIGGFVSFPSEVVRTTFNTLELSVNEMKSGNPNLVKIGQTRLAGSMLALGMSTAAAYGTRALLHMDGDDEKDLRRFVGPWQEDNEFVYLNKEGSKYTIVDMGAFDPHSYLKKPIYAAMRGDDLKESMMGMVKETIAPFLNEQVATQKAIDLWRNQTPKGKQVYNPDSGLGNMAHDMLEYFFKGISPGFIKAGMNLNKAIGGITDDYGKEYRLSDELLAIFPGARVQTIDVSTSVKYKASDIRKRMAQADADFFKVQRSKSATREDLAKARERLSETISNVFMDASDIRGSALRLGADVKTMDAIDWRKYQGLINVQD